MLCNYVEAKCMGKRHISATAFRQFKKFQSEIPHTILLYAFTLFHLFYCFTIVKSHKTIAAIKLRKNRLTRDVRPRFAKIRCGCSEGSQEKRSNLRRGKYVTRNFYEEFFYSPYWPDLFTKVLKEQNQIARFIVLLEYVLWNEFIVRYAILYI